MKPILCLDFDGVIHSYSSGWKGARTIPDAPVPGALQFIVEALAHFDVQIFSSRSNYLFGRMAMKAWLRRNLIALSEEDNSNLPDWWLDVIRDRFLETYEPYHVISREQVDLIIKQIKWPTQKPPATLTIDDRAWQFTGTWPAFSDIKAFKPWNKRTATAKEKA